MVEVKFVIELVIIIASLALVVFIFWSNYAGLADQFFGWLKATPDLLTGG